VSTGCLLNSAEADILYTGMLSPVGETNERQQSAGIWPLPFAPDKREVGSSSLPRPMDGNRSAAGLIQGLRRFRVSTYHGLVPLRGASSARCYPPSAARRGGRP